VAGLQHVTSTSSCSLVRISTGRPCPSPIPLPYPFDTRHLRGAASRNACIRWMRIACLYRQSLFDVLALVVLPFNAWRRPSRDASLVLIAKTPPGLPSTQLFHPGQVGPTCLLHLLCTLLLRCFPPIHRWPTVTPAPPPTTHQKQRRTSTRATAHTLHRRRFQAILATASGPNLHLNRP